MSAWFPVGKGKYHDKTILENCAKNDIRQVVNRAHRCNANLVHHRHIIHKLVI